MNKKRKIVMPANGTILSGHFGRATHFVVYDVEDNKIVNRQIVDAPKHEHGSFPNFIIYLGATDVIAGGMGPAAIEHLNQAGINVFLGAKEIDTSTIVEEFLAGTYTFNENLCDHGKGGTQNHHH